MSPIDFLLDDPFALHRVNMMKLQKRLQEAWSREKKAEIVAKEKAKGHDLAAHEIFGDYDLTLWRVPTHRGTYLMVGLNGGEWDPTDLNTQKQPAGHGRIPFQPICKKISEWVDAHGSVVVGSAVQGKTKLYLKWLTRLGYRLVPFLADDYRFGAVVSREKARSLAERIIEHVLATE